MKYIKYIENYIEEYKKQKDFENIKGVALSFNLIEQKKGFGLAYYRTIYNRASVKLSNRLNKYLQKNFPDNQFKFCYEGVYMNISVIKK